MDMNVNKSDGLVYVENFVDGEFEAASSYVDSYEPATGKVWAKIPDSDAATVDRAASAASGALPAWAALSFAARARLLSKAADLLEARADEFARMESKDQGKPVTLAKNMDISRAVLNLRAFAEAWPSHVESSDVLPDAGVVNYSLRSPVGVAGIIAPWNLPLYLLTFKLAPALMAGCTVVAKPSEMTTVTAWMLMKIFKECGLPAGVLNFVCGVGPGAGEAIVRHPLIRVVSFTGSTAVGERIAGIAAPMMKRLSLELGGKNAAIVFDDADVDKAVATLVRSCFLNQGEICLCTARLFVQDGVYDELLGKLVEATKKLKVGDPEDKDVFMGALNSKPHLEKVKRYMGYAIEDGGQILCGETPDAAPFETNARCKDGYFFRPTVIVGLEDSSRCMQEEIFGPVVCVSRFSNEDEALRRANDVKYGLCASVWTENSGRLHRVSHGLEVGTVWANCWLIRSLAMPFGGCKGSGIGREGIHHSMEFYTEEKTVCVKFK